MAPTRSKTICWRPLWNERYRGVGLEHLLLTETVADSVVLAIDEEQMPFRLSYHLHWDDAWRLREAALAVATGSVRRSLELRTDGEGNWWSDGRALSELSGCLDIDIWPTPFTNTFPLCRRPLAVGERREYRMAWVSAPQLTVTPQPQAYTRLASDRYLFESLDGSGFRAELVVDEAGIVLDYPQLFQRVALDG